MKLVAKFNIFNYDVMATLPYHQWRDLGGPLLRCPLQAKQQLLTDQVGILCTCVMVYPQFMYI